MQENIDGLVRQIQLAVNDEDVTDSMHSNEDFTVTEMRTELERIRVDTESVKPSSKANSELCALPGDVIELPPGISISTEMHTLLEKVTQPTHTNRIGFCVSSST